MFVGHFLGFAARSGDTHLDGLRGEQAIHDVKQFISLKRLCQVGVEPDLAGRDGDQSRHKQ